MSDTSPERETKAPLLDRARNRLRRGWRRAAAFAWPTHPDRWRDVPHRLVPTVVTTVRLTSGAVLGYLMTLLITGSRTDITGALTALLVMQASAYSTLRMGIIRVGAVLGGVLVATLLSNWIGLSWWSLGAAVAVSLVLSKVLRLGEQAIEMPISAMLILAVSDPGVAAETRVFNTLIGAGVGITLNLLYPPSMPIRPAGDSIRAVAAAVAAPLRQSAEALRAGPITRGQVAGWTGALDLASRRVDQASAAVNRLRDSRRLNPRAIGFADLAPVLTSGLASLDSCLLAVRALFTVMRTEVPDGEAPDDPYGAELRDAFAVVLDDLADSVIGFGSLVVAEATSREEEVERRLDHTLDVLRETKAILAELITVQPGGEGSAWLLRGSILTAIDQVLAQLDVEERSRARRQWQEDQARRATLRLPSLVQAALPHPELPYIRGIADVVVSRREAAEDDEETAGESAEDSGEEDAADEKRALPASTRKPS